MRMLGLLVAAAATLGAHEIGTTRVSAMFEDGGTYSIVVVTDAGTLKERLDAAGAGSFEDKFLRRVKVQFDGVAVQPVVARTEADGVATVRLTGAVPAGARAFTWGYSWTFTTYSLMMRRGGSAQPVSEWLEGGQMSKPFDLAGLGASPFLRLSTAWRYLGLGFTHILPYGLDHVLFVLGIYLLSGRARAVLWQVSAFTLAHSITLALSMYGVVSAPASIVEPLIALSIAYVAVENIFLSELKSWRVALVFAFGLLHGMGFAGVLQELGLPREEFVTALLTFNLGVEAGQLAVIGLAFLLVGWRWSERAWYRARVVVPASAMIAVVAVYWTIERIWF